MGPPPTTAPPTAPDTTCPTEVMADRYTMATLTITGTTNGRNQYQFRASGPVSKSGSSLNDNDAIDDNEVRGGVSTGTDTIVFSGVPIAFEADSPWQLDLALDMGGERVEFMPTFLNSVTVTIRSEGAHYLLGTAGPGMILRDSKADPRDGVVDSPNHLVAGNVRDGGEDSWRVWPPMGVHGVADHPADFRVEDGEWQSMKTISPTMEF